MSIRMFCIWGLLPLCLLVFLAGSERSRRIAEGGAGIRPAPRGAIVLFSSELNGNLTPCGCSKPMLGGVPRRASYIRSLSSEAFVIKVENGDLTKALNRQDELKAETLIEIFNHLGYNAIALGEKDFRLGLSYLQSLQARFKGAFLCANVLGADGKPLFKEYTVVKREQDGQTVRVVIVGLLSEQFAEVMGQTNPDLKITPVDEVLTRLGESLTKEGDIRILLYHGPRSEAEQLAKSYPQFQMVVYAHEGDHPVEVKKVGETTLACSGQDGKYLGHATLAAASPWRVEQVKYVVLDPEWKDDPRILEMKMAYLNRVEGENLLGQVPKRPTADGSTFMGSEACAGCHQQAYAVWKGSKHAGALQTLVNEKHDKDPECVVCHVVGLEFESGFKNVQDTPLLKDVGCESCHGPASKHVLERVKMPKAGSASCLQCHVPEHSPKFDFDTYWEMIKH